MEKLSPSTDNLVLGRGRLYFDRFDANGDKQGWIDLGNAPNFTVNISKETLPHFSSRTGIRTKDLEVVRELASSFQFTLEEFSLQNITLAIIGATSAANQSSSSAVDQAVVARLDKWIDLGKLQVSNVVVTGSGGSPTYDVDDDYNVDADAGMIMCLSTGAITDEEDLLVDYSYAAVNMDLIKALTDSKIEGSLKFVGDPGAGPPLIIEVWKGNLMPSGEMGFISEEWANFQLAFEVTKDEIGHASNPYFGVWRVNQNWV